MAPYKGSLLCISALLGIARAHFQLQYPIPRGPFVETNEVNFCGMPSILPGESLVLYRYLCI